MIDSITKEPIEVSINERASPHLMIPYSQFDEICALLDSNNIDYYPDEEIYSVDDEPEVIFITIHREKDGEVVQRLLDSIP